MKFSKFLSPSFLLGASAILFLLYNGERLELVDKIRAKSNPSSDLGKLYEKINLYNEVLKKVSDNYVDNVSEEELIMKSIRGMVQSLDPFSAYMSPEDLKEMEVETRGQFGGLGIEITKKDNYILVISPIEDTPAWRAGIQAGDRILKIDGQSTKDMSLMEAVRKLRGPKGTRVTITIWREGWTEPRNIELIRDIIKIKSVKSAMVDDKILYVRISSFQEGTSKELLEAFKKAGLFEGAITGVILDLRGNPGGLLSEAIKASDIFVGDEVIVSTKGRNDSKSYSGRKDTYDFPANVSLIVLVDRGSASASEIMAGALKDNKKGIIVGTRTFGKASVQTIIPLSNGGALRLTTAHYYTPKGTNIEESGIEPDIVFKYSKKPPTSEEVTPEEIVHKREHPEDDEMVKFAISIIKGKLEKSAKIKMQNHMDVN